MNIKKFISLVTSCCFLFSIFTQNIFAYINSNTNIDEYVNNDLFSNKYGKITDIKKQNNNLSVINIQDLHSNYCAQTNIKNILDSLQNQFNIKKIFIEGGYEKVDISWINKIGDKTYRNRIVNQLMLDGRLTGTELFAYESKLNDILFGLEDKEVHQQNLSRLSKIFDKQNYFTSELVKIKSDIDFLSSKYFSDDNLYLNKIINKYNTNKIDAKEFYTKLQNLVNKVNKNSKKYNNFISINFNDFNNINKYVLLSSQKINNKKVINELKNFLSILKNNLSYLEYNKIIADTNNLTDINKLCICIENFTIKNNIDLSQNYFNLQKYIQNNKVISSINPLQIISEERRLLNNLRQAFSNNDTEYEISFLTDFYYTFNDYLKNKITPNNYAYFNENFEKFKNLYSKYSVVDRLSNLENDFKLLNDYYATNDLRNNIFLDKITSNIDINTLNKNDVIVVVSGGYHTSGLSELLKGNNIGYMTITPNVDGSEQNFDNNYRNIIKEQAEVNSNALSFALASSVSNIEQFNSLVMSAIELAGGIYSKEILESIVEKLKPLVDSDVSLNYSNNQSIISVGNRNIVLNNIDGKIEYKKVSSLYSPVSLKTSFINKFFEKNSSLNFSDGIIFELRNADKILTEINGIDLAVISRFPKIIQKYFYNQLSDKQKEQILDINKNQTLTKDSKTLSRIKEIKNKIKRNRLLKFYSIVVAPIIEAPIINKIFDSRYIDTNLYYELKKDFFNKHEEYNVSSDEVKKNYEYDLDFIINNMQITYDKIISSIHNERIAKIASSIVGINAHKKVNKQKFKIEKEKTTIGQKIKKGIKVVVITLVTALLMAFGIATYIHPSDLTSTISSNMYAFTNIDLSSEQNYYESLLETKIEWTDTYMPDLDNLYYTYIWKYQLYQMENQIADGIDVILSNNSLSSLLHKAYTDNEIEYLKILSVRNDREKLKDIANDESIDRYYRFYAHMLLVEDGYKQKDGEFEELFNRNKILEWINYTDNTQIELTDFEWQTKCYVVKEIMDVDISEDYIVRFARLVKTPEGSDIVARSDLSYGNKNIKSGIWSTTAHEIGHNDMSMDLLFLDLLPSSSIKELYAYSWETIFSLETGINNNTYRSRSLMSVNNETEEHDAGRTIITSVNENLGEEYSSMLASSILEYYKTVPINKTVREETLGILDIFADKVIDKEISENKISESYRTERKTELICILMNYNSFFEKYIDVNNSNEQIRQLSQYIYDESKDVTTEKEFFKALLNIKIQMTSLDSNLFPEGTDQVYLSKWNSILNRLNETIISNVDTIERDAELNAIFKSVYTDDEIEYVNIYNLSLDKEDTSELERIITSNKDMKYRFYAYTTFVQKHRTEKEKYSGLFSKEEISKYLIEYSNSNLEMTEISNYDWQVLCGMTQLLYDEGEFTLYNFDTIFSTKYDENTDYKSLVNSNPYWYQYSLDYVKSKTKNPVLVAVAANELYSLNKSVIGYNQHVMAVKEDLTQLYVDICLIQASRDLSIDINIDLDTNLSIKDIKDGTSSEDISKIVLNEVINEYGYGNLQVLKDSIYEYVSTGGPIYEALSYIQSSLGSAKSMDELRILIDNYIEENNLTGEIKEGVLDFTNVFFDGRKSVQARDYGTRLSRYSNFLPGEKLNVEEAMKIFYEKMNADAKLTKDNKITNLIDKIKNNKVRVALRNIYSVVVAPLVEVGIINDIYYEEDEVAKQEKINKFLQDHKGYKQGDQIVKQSYEQGLDFILESMKDSYNRIYNKTHHNKIAKLAVTISNIKYHKKWNRENIANSLKNNKHKIAKMAIVLFATIFFAIGTIGAIHVSHSHSSQTLYSGYVNTYKSHLGYFDEIFDGVSSNASETEMQKIKNLQKYIDSIVDENGKENFYDSLLEIRKGITTLGTNLMPSISNEDSSYTNIWRQVITYIDKTIAYNINDISSDEQMNVLLQDAYSTSEIEYLKILSISNKDELLNIINSDKDLSYRFYAYMVLEANNYTFSENEISNIANKDVIYDYLNTNYTFENEKGVINFLNVENSYDWQVLCGMMNYVLDAKDDYKYIIENGRIVEAKADPDGVNAMAKSNLLYAHISSNILPGSNESPVLIAAHEMAHRRQNNTFGYLSNTMELYAYTVENIIGEEMGIEVDYLRSVPSYTITTETETHELGRTVIESVKRVTGVDSLVYLENSIVEYVSSKPSKNTSQVQMVDSVLDIFVTKIVDKEIADGTLKETQRQTRYNEIMVDIYGYNTFFDSIYSVENERTFKEADKDFKEYVYSTFTGIENKETFFSKLLEIRYSMENNMPTIDTYSNTWKKILSSIDETITSNIEYIKNNNNLSKQLNSIYTQTELEYMEISSTPSELENVITSNKDINYRFYAYMLFFQEDRKEAKKYDNLFSEQYLKEYLLEYSSKNPQMTEISNYDWQVLCGMTQILYSDKLSIYSFDNVISIDYDSSSQYQTKLTDNPYVYQYSLNYVKNLTSNPILVAITANALDDIGDCFVGSCIQIAGIREDLVKLYIDSYLIDISKDLSIDVNIDTDSKLSISDINDETSPEDISKIVLNEVINKYGYEALPLLEESVREYISSGGAVYSVLLDIYSEIGSRGGTVTIEEFNEIVDNYIKENDLTEIGKKALEDFVPMVSGNKSTIQARDYNSSMSRYNNIAPNAKINVDEVMKIFESKLATSPKLTIDNKITKNISKIKNRKIKNSLINIYSVVVAPLLEASFINKIYFEKDETLKQEARDEFLKAHKEYKQGNKKVKQSYEQGVDFILNSMKDSYERIYNKTHCQKIANLAVRLSNIKQHSRWNRNLFNTYSLIDYTKQKLGENNMELVSEFNKLKFKETKNRIEVLYKYSLFSKSDIIILEADISKEEFYSNIKTLLQTHNADLIKMNFMNKIISSFTRVYNRILNNISSVVFNDIQKNNQVAVIYKAISSKQINSYAKYTKDVDTGLLYENIFVVEDSISEDIIDKLEFKSIGIKCNENPIFVSDNSDSIFVYAENSNFDYIVNSLKNNVLLNKKILSHINSTMNTNITIDDSSIISTKITSNKEKNIAIEDDLISVSQQYNNVELIEMLSSYTDVMTRQGFVVKENLFRYVDDINASLKKEERKQAFINILQEQMTTQLIFDYDIFNQLQQDFGHEVFKNLIQQLKERNIRLYVCISNENNIKDIVNNEFISGYILFKDIDFKNINSSSETKNITCKIFDNLTCDSFEANFIAQENSNSCKKILDTINSNIFKQPLIFRDSSIKQAVNNQRDTTIYNNFKSVFSVGKLTNILSNLKSTYNSKKFINTYKISELAESFDKDDINLLLDLYKKYFNKDEEISINAYTEFINILSKSESLKKFFNVSELSKIDNIDSFIENIIFRINVADVLKEQGKEMGLKNQKYEEILAKALKIKFVNGIENSDIDYEVLKLSQIQDVVTKEQTLKKYIDDNIMKLTQRAFSKEQPDSIAINTIIFLMPYAEVADIEIDVNDMLLQQHDLNLTKSILSAA